MATAAATTTAAAASHLFGTRIRIPNPSSGRFQARFGFGRKKTEPPAKKATPKSTAGSERLVWFPGATPPEWLDGSMVGDRGFDPFGLGKPVDYLQFDLDSLDQNLAKNVAGDVIGVRAETTELKPTPFQPYSEVFGLQRFRECELIHGRWAMLGTLGAVAVEALTGVAWQDAGKVRINYIRTYIRMKTDIRTCMVNSFSFVVCACVYVHIYFNFIFLSLHFSVNIACLNRISIYI
ncbi:chlorophyll a-b binding protein CP29.3, chloroplastic-like [Carica papaya]|uniref:chlorophyll a-b binding protein CP29.3, chloroplastic-like n=1 Tax=Carica papaya TaxID=3649 RepID=UPI000B8CFFF0|nr:chlorophyll a-b binding protein CP29.3, chloroplastic-like [Carica papaya]